MPFSPDRMRGHRHGLKLTYTEVADASGIDLDRWIAIESHTAVPGAGEWMSIADALQVSIDELQAQHPRFAADYCSAVLAHHRDLTEVEIEIAAATVRHIRAGAA